jgi:hypothetical protein
MTVNLPENLNDLTLEQWQKIVAIDEKAEPQFYVQRVLSIVYGLKSVNNVKNYDVDLLTNTVRGLLEQQPKFINRFKMDSVEYGFIPNFDNITFGELVDLDEYMEKENYHKLMSILFRPITKKQSGGRYKIEKYKGSGDLSQMPLGVALGAIGFFLTLGSQLVTDTLNSLTPQEVAQAQRQDMQKSGVGSVQSIS